MSLSICDHCGGHVSLGHEASNRCTGCGRRNAVEHDPLPPVAGIDDSELVALRAEVARLKKEVEEKMWDVVSWGQRYDRVLCELGEVKKERDALKKTNAQLGSDLKASHILLSRRSMETGPSCGF